MAPHAEEASATRSRATSGAGAVALSAGTRCYIPDKTRIWLPVTVEYINPQTQMATFIVDPSADTEDANSDGADGEEDASAAKTKTTKHRTVEMSLSEQPHLPLQNARAQTRDGYDDMIDLNHLHEAAILYNLKRRFHARLPYTYTGDICLAVNPYQWLSELYSPQLHKQYLSATSRKQLPPHVYAVSVAAFKRMRSEERNQSILVSGESGAGKTETTKILMDNLAHIGSLASSGASSSSDDSTIQRILDVNPLLESFGNAKTKRNDNSSRFGKFTQLQFQRHEVKKTKVLPGKSEPAFSMVLCGAKCETYLLEKTRVVTQEAGERNYHIFYQLFQGGDATEKEACMFLETDKITSFAYLSPSSADAAATQSEADAAQPRDTKHFAKTKHALSLLGLDSAAQMVLFQTLAGIMHLGQMTFAANPDNDEASHVVTGSGEVPGALLGLAADEMEKALCYRTVKAGGEVYTVPMVADKAASSRDALAKAIYAKVFQWMVEKINARLSAPESDVANTIGVLDIFGFESFVHNSFEQLCINYANEKLQQKFTQDVFKGVQEEYEQESITWGHISYADNADVLAMIDGKMGIISLLNEEIVRPKGNDEGFVSKLATAFRPTPQPKSKTPQKKIIEFPRTSRTQFAVHHYADVVKYEATGFLEKHKDALLPDLADLMRSSDAAFVCELFEEKVDTLAGVVAAASKAADGDKPAANKVVGAMRRGASGGGASQTVGTQFKLSLNRLMDNINQTSVHYIRCIKPNSEKSTTKIDENMVVNQLRCAGVIEAISIARAGYPNRMKHREFAIEFDLFLSESEQDRLAAQPEGDGNKIIVELCNVLARQFELQSPEEFQMGQTKIYLQNGILERLEGAKAEKLFACVAMIQAQWRGLQGRRQYRVMYASALFIQQRAHVLVAQIRLKRSKAAVALMQRVYRGHIGRREYHAQLCEFRALQIQCAWRSHKSYKTLLRLRKEYEEEQARLYAIEQERLRQLKLQHERELAEQARLERERIAREERERKEREERERYERMERERREKEERERREREEQERLERERLERERIAREALEASSAIAVQRIARGKLARQQYMQLKFEKEEQDRLERERLAREALELSSAITIQRIARGKLARQEYLQRKLEWEEQQRLEEERLAREALEADSAVIVQRIARGNLARRRFAQLKFEQEERERLEQERIEREALELNSAITVQRIARGRLARQCYTQLKLEREEQERVERERLAREALELDAAITVQRIARGKLARQHYTELQLLRKEREENAAITVQRIARGKLARQQYAVLKEDASHKCAHRSALAEALEENNRLREQLEELMEANIELEALVSEWKDEHQVIRASRRVEETNLKHQIKLQKAKLATSTNEYDTLCSYIEQNGGEATFGSAHNRDINVFDDFYDEQARTDIGSGSHASNSDRGSIVDSGSESDSDLSVTSPEDSFTSPFADDRPAIDGTSILQPTSIWRAGASKLNLAKSWGPGRATPASTPKTNERKSAFEAFLSRTSTVSNTRDESEVTTGPRSPATTPPPITPPDSPPTTGARKPLFGGWL